MTIRTHKPRVKPGRTTHAPKKHSLYIPVPIAPPADCTLSLDKILKTDKIIKAGEIVFHAVGDTGGIHGTETQEAVAVAMEKQSTSFMYNLGDVVYFNGQSDLYEPQFYEPYKYYPAHIFAIPGNHDGDTTVRSNDLPDNEPSLYGFFKNFCAAKSTKISTYRDSITQPYVYWTLLAPFVKIIGLYGNVDGTLDTAQQDWLVSQLKHDAATCLIIAVHQPPYSLDTSHGGYPDIGDAIDAATKKTGIYPSLVLSGHVHNYQRFERKVKDGVIPYIIAGAGGYANFERSLHKIQKIDKLPFVTEDKAVTLQAYNEQDAGFLRLSVNDKEVTVEYFAVPFNGMVPDKPYDSFVLNYQTSTVK